MAYTRRVSSEMEALLKARGWRRRGSVPYHLAEDLDMNANTLSLNLSAYVEYVCKRKRVGYRDRNIRRFGRIEYFSPYLVHSLATYLERSGPKPWPRGVRP